MERGNRLLSLAVAGIGIYLAYAKTTTDSPLLSTGVIHLVAGISLATWFRYKNKEPLLGQFTSGQRTSIIATGVDPKAGGVQEIVEMGTARDVTESNLSDEAAGKTAKMPVNPSALTVSVGTVSSGDTMKGLPKNPAVPPTKATVPKKSTALAASKTAAPKSK